MPVAGLQLAAAGESRVKIGRQERAASLSVLEQLLWQPGPDPRAQLLLSPPTKSPGSEVDTEGASVRG